MFNAVSRWCWPWGPPSGLMSSAVVVLMSCCQLSIGLGASTVFGGGCAEFCFGLFHVVSVLYSFWCCMECWCRNAVSCWRVVPPVMSKKGRCLHTMSRHDKTQTHTSSKKFGHRCGWEVGNGRNSPLLLRPGRFGCTGDSVTRAFESNVSSIHQASQNSCKLEQTKSKIYKKLTAQRLYHFVEMQSRVFYVVYLTPQTSK